LPILTQHTLPELGLIERVRSSRPKAIQLANALQRTVYGCQVGLAWTLTTVDYRAAKIFQ
jgi:hypothetical protein